jgi:hypothetical protein
MPSDQFTDPAEPSPHDSTAPGAAKADRLRAEADKLEAYCVVVRAASAAADHAAFAARHPRRCMPGSAAARSLRFSHG